jgi:hypothetical protein
VLTYADLNQLEFGSGDNLASIFPNLQHLIMGELNNHDEGSSSIILPETLKSLDLMLVRPDLGFIPSTIQSLNIGSYSEPLALMEAIKERSWPELHTLKVRLNMGGAQSRGGHHSLDDVFPGCFPSSLTHLSISLDFYGKLNANIWEALPSTLVALEIISQATIPVSESDVLHLSRHLRSFVLRGAFSGPLPVRVLPQSLTKLHLESYAKLAPHLTLASIQFLPKQLTSLFSSCTIDSTVEDKQIELPPALTSLHLTCPRGILFPFSAVPPTLWYWKASKLEGQHLDNFFPEDPSIKSRLLHFEASLVAKTGIALPSLPSSLMFVTLAIHAFWVPLDFLPPTISELSISFWPQHTDSAIPTDWLQQLKSNNLRKFECDGPVLNLAQLSVLRQEHRFVSIQKLSFHSNEPLDDIMAMLPRNLIKSHIVARAPQSWKKLFNDRPLSLNHISGRWLGPNPKLLPKHVVKYFPKNLKKFGYIVDGDTALHEILYSERSLNVPINYY